MGCVAAPVSRHARDRAGRGLLHVRHGSRQQPAVEGRAESLSGCGREEVSAGSWGAPALSDLSATVYGGRVALAAMAKTLGKHDEAARWEQDAETLRKLIITGLYDPQDAAFYDLDTDNKFVRVRSDVISRVLGEHVLKMNDTHDRAIFEAVWTKQLHNPKAFWAPYPLTSVAMDDPSFVRPIPRNSWGGACRR